MTASRNILIHGDCLTVLRELPPQNARLIIADPPYFRVLTEQPWDMQWPDEQAYLAWTAQWMQAAMRHLQPGGLLYCFGQLGKREHVMLHLMSQAASNFATASPRQDVADVRWSFHDLIIWDRVVGYNERRDSFTPAYEMILVLRRKGPVYFDKDAVREPYDEATIREYVRDKRYKDMEAREEHLRKGKYATNLWRIPSLKGGAREKAGHPSQKPSELIKRIILSSSAPGDLVLDPFMGSGTTAVVAEAHRRDWLGIEVSPDYVKLAEARIAEERMKAEG
jgi:site-specific DNA-methyltransferase (adenine-specific)